MKKNAILERITPKDSNKSIWKRLDILPRLLCLVLALIVWLLVVNTQDFTDKKPIEDASGITEVVS